MSMSRVLALVVRLRSAHYNKLASQSLRLPMLHLFRTMDAGRPRGVEYSVDMPRCAWRRILLDGTLYRPRLQVMQA